MAHRYIAPVAKAVPTDPTCMHCRSKAAGICRENDGSKTHQAASEGQSFRCFRRGCCNASSLHESRCFITSRARGFRTPSSIYFQPMKQTRSDVLPLHSADRPGPFLQHGTASAMSSSLAILFEEDGDTGIRDESFENR